MALATKFKLTYHDAPAAGRLALLTMDNGADHTKPTTFGAGALDSLEAALDELSTQPDVKGLLLTGKPFVFAVGADLDEFVGAAPPFAREASRRGHQLFDRLRDLPLVTLAAINGACMGGGLEIALHCDYRTVSSAATALAFPEVFLSIVPAWGGTQLAPRIAGAANALKAIVHNPLRNNRMMRPADAVRLGLVDRLIPAVDFLDASRALLERLITGGEPIERSEPSQQDLDKALASARRTADDRVHGATPAPYVAIDLVEFAARGGDLDEGLRREEDALAELLFARQAQAAVYSFNLTQRRVRRQPWKPAAEPRPVRKVGVVGAGLMGAQLGALFVQRLEVPIVMKDIDQGVLDQARAHIEAALDQRVAKGRMTAAKAGFLSSIVEYTLDCGPLGGADLVIEAVLERLDLKQRVFADVEAVVDAGCVLATNTSSLSVTAMAAKLAHPERVVGLHFFNPVAILPLVEVAKTEQASAQALATAFEVAKALRKSAVGCADTPGFVVNRILTRLIGVCAAAVGRGADFAEVDDAVLALGLPMGPFALIGLVGLGVAARLAETMHEAFGDRFPLDPNLRMLGEIGLPAVYDWDKDRTPYDEIRERWRVEVGAPEPTPDEIRAEILDAVADEARRLLDERVVADARDIDTCMLLGAGWPFFMGGVCKYLDQTGVSQRLFGAPLVGEHDAAAPR
ncbi:MAG: 3-hydroxyacyl-CoA dehydrogenase NAD-binding domain-containing protein [Egibacteraceae bacterium]